MNLAEHPTVRRFHESRAGRPASADERLSLDDIACQAQPNPLHPQHGAHHHG